MHMHLRTRNCTHTHACAHVRLHTHARAHALVRHRCSRSIALCDWTCGLIGVLPQVTFGLTLFFGERNAKPAAAPLRGVCLLLRLAVLFVPVYVASLSRPWHGTE